MTISKADAVTQYLDGQTVALLEELGTECEAILKLLAQLEVPGLREEQAEDLLGDLSAAILHLHHHTQGLDERIDESAPASK